MSDKIASVRQPVIGAFIVDHPGGPWIKAQSELNANDIADAINRAYLIGKAHARREVRAALGLKDWGGQVTVPPESR